MGEASLKERLPPPGTSADALFRMGLRLSTRSDEGAELDPPAALALFDLAAKFGSIEAKIYRHELSEEMDQADIVEAQRIVRQWLAAA